MEFPHLGEHCSQEHCKKLDFLPMKCDACAKIFCHEHFTYLGHDCPSAYKKNVQVPVCPLCNIPIPTKRGQLPDIAVGAHIDSDCQSDPAKSRRTVFSNKCSAKNCKQRELVPVMCQDCQLNHCLKHRHPQDHQCTGSRGSSKPLEAALSRKAKSSGPPSMSNTDKFKRPIPPQSAIQGQMSEDEALSLALQASLADNQPSPSGLQHLTLEEEDEMLARAIAESEREQRRAAQAPPASGRTMMERCRMS